MTITAHRQAMRLAASAAAIGLLAAACSSSSKKSSTSTSGSSTASTAGGTNTASAPGITASSITIGSHQPLSGPAAPGYSEIAPASDAYFKYVNAHGGVYGRSINFKFLDDGYNPANTVSVVHELVQQDNVFGIFEGLGTPTHLAVEDFLNANKIPDLFVASGCTCWNNASKDPETFGWQPDYTIEGEIQGQYVKQNYAGKKVGYFAQDDEFGTDGVKGLDEQIPASSVASRQKYDVTNINVGPQIAALQAAGVQVVVSYSIPAFTALALGAAAKLNYHPTWVVSNVGADITTLKGLLGAAGSPLIEGVVSDAYLPVFTDTSNPWVQLFKQVHDQYDASAPLDGNVMYGFAAAYTFVQVMFNAGRNPTRADVVKAVEAAHFPSGPWTAPFSYSSSNHQGISGTQMGTIKNGAFVATGTPYTATDTGNIAASTQAPSTPPPNGIPTASS
jgi:ABC-type branched-subunit amino acid transport system substrate-binding protein